MIILALIIISGIGFSAITLFTMAFLVSSIQEKEQRASVLASIQFVISLGLTISHFHLGSIGFYTSGTGFIVLVTIFCFGVLGTLLLLLPIGNNRKALDGTKGLITAEVKRVDERDIEFSKHVHRILGSDLEDWTDPDRSIPGVFPEMGKIDGSGGFINVAMTRASSSACSKFGTLENLSPEVSSRKIKLAPKEASEKVKSYANNLGAALVGITELNPLWIYSNYGYHGIRHNEWGKEVTIKHKYAVVFATEMDIENVNAAPHTPVIVETMMNYAKGAFISTQVASFIAKLGYSATANHNDHYDTMVVPLAVDAGLGELSRMGYLLTKEYGPRIRLSAVTTDLPLVPDKPIDIGVVDFCNKCRKCAHCCPSNSINSDDRSPNNGTMRWVIDTESCFRFWQKVGTDCAICMRVCPWSHARTFPHKVITELITRNALARTLFNRMDDIYYGKRPGTKNPPEWTDYRSGS